MSRNRVTAQKKPSTMEPARDHGSAGGYSRHALLVLVVGLAAGYLLLFITGGETRREFYDRLIRVYALLPDRLLAELFELWTDGRWQSAMIWDRWPILLAACGFLTASWSCGRLLIGSCSARYLTTLELFLFSTAVGINVWSTYVVILGWSVGFSWPWLLRLPMIVVTLLGVGYHIRRPRVSVPLPVMADTPMGKTGRPEWLFLALVPLVVFYVLTAVLPPWEFDVREYHLQTPKEWFQAGQVTFLPHNVYGNMPLGAEMPGLVAMLWMPGPLAWWWGALVGKLMLSVIALLTSLAIYAFGCRFFHPLAGVVGALAYLSTPWVFHVSTVGLVEGALGFFLFLSLYAALLAGSVRARVDPPGRDESAPRQVAEPQRTKDPDGRETGELIDAGENVATANGVAGTLPIYALGGYLAGAAVACKYTGLVFVVFPVALLVVWQSRSRSRRHGVAALTLFALLAVAGSGVWFAKNLAFTGNPTYPLLYSLFGGEPWNEQKNERWQEAHGAPRNAAGHRFSLAQLRAAIIDLSWYSDRLNPLMITLMLLALLERRQRHLQVLLVVFLLLNFTTWWLLTHRYDRFFVPMFPVMAVLAGIGGAWWGRRGAYPFLIAFLLAGVFVNTLVVSSGVLTGDNRILVPLDVLREDSWRSIRIHPAHRYLNQHVPPGHAALLVGEAQVFDLEVPVFYSTCWDDSFLELWTKGKTREERLEILKKHRISHVFVHWHEIQRYRSPGNYGFTDYVTKQLIRDELVAEQGILRPVPVPTDDGVLNPENGELFEVTGE